MLITRSYLCFLLLSWNVSATYNKIHCRRNVHMKHMSVTWLLKLLTAMKPIKKISLFLAYVKLFRAIKIKFDCNLEMLPQI